MRRTTDTLVNELNNNATLIREKAIAASASLVRMAQANATQIVQEARIAGELESQVCQPDSHAAVLGACGWHSQHWQERVAHYSLRLLGTTLGYTRPTMWHIPVQRLPSAASARASASACLAGGC